jgi:hypothetical protein
MYCFTFKPPLSASLKQKSGNAGSVMLLNNVLLVIAAKQFEFGMLGSCPGSSGAKLEDMRKHDIDIVPHG